MRQRGKSWALEGALNPTPWVVTTSINIHQVFFFLPCLSKPLLPTEVYPSALLDYSIDS